MLQLLWLHGMLQLLCPSPICLLITDLSSWPHLNTALTFLQYCPQWLLDHFWSLIASVDILTLMAYLELDLLRHWQRLPKEVVDASSWRHSRSVWRGSKQPNLPVGVSVHHRGAGLLTSRGISSIPWFFLGLWLLTMSFTSFVFRTCVKPWEACFWVSQRF